jgi:hypothetical protein
MEHVYQSLRHAIQVSNVRPLAVAQKYRSLDSGAGSPRMRIENEFWSRPGTFRKIHLERALVEPRDVDIIHMVAYPDIETDLPILGIDVVTFGGRPTMCIADPSPTRRDMSLPEPYHARVRDLWRDHDIRALIKAAPREPPSWASEIFGPFCVLAGECPLDQFGAYAAALLDMHMSYAMNGSPGDGSPEDGSPEDGSPEDVSPEDVARAIRRYTRQQRKNTKTQNMLRSCFGTEFAKDYMATVMFDSAV